MQNCRILGIDPGFGRFGICILDKKDNKEILIHSECVETSKKDPFEKRLSKIGTTLERMFKKYKPEELAIEKVFFTKNVRTAINVSEVRGICLYLAYKHNISIYEYSPPEIKLSVAGHGGATKSNVLFMVQKILSKQLGGKLLDDEIDAIAIALTHSAHRKIKALK